MNFEKVERIFIIAFLVLNIFLFVNYMNRQNLQHSSNDTTQVDFIKEMQNSGIEVSDKLADANKSEKAFSMQANANQLLKENQDSLREQAGSVDDEGVLYRSLLSNPIELEGAPEKGFSKEDIKKLEDLLATNLFIFGEEYKYSHYNKENKQFIFNQTIEEIQVADGTSQIVMNVNDKGEVFSYEQTYAGPMTKQGRPLTIISALRAVEVLFVNNQIPKNSKLSMPKLTYRRSLHLEDLSMYTPTWLVEVTGESEETEILRVDAYSGTVLHEEAVTKTEETETEE